MRELRVRVVRRMPHDPDAFTQGLLVDGDTVVESTGGYGTSGIRRVRLDDNREVVRHRLPDARFGEGVAAGGGVVWQLTWRERVAIRRDPATLREIGEVPYDGEGWGAGADGDGIWTSDGSSTLTRRRPVDLAPIGELAVRLDGEPVPGLNDLTAVTGGAWAGLVWANVLGVDALAGIDAATGAVVAAADARSLRPPWLDGEETALNGIAWVPGTDRFLVTGKWWPYLYVVELEAGGDGFAAEALLYGVSV